MDPQGSLDDIQKFQHRNNKIFLTIRWNQETSVKNTGNN